MDTDANEMTEEEIRECESSLRVMASRHSLVVAKDEENRVVAAATATLLMIGGKHYVVTADHVLSALSERGTIQLQTIGSEALEAPQCPHLSRDFSLDPSSRSCIALGDQREADFATISAPQELVHAAHVGWFEGEEEIAAARTIRANPRTEGGKRHHVLLLGYPLFSRFSDHERRLQAFGSVPMRAYLERFDDPPAWSGRIPQVILAVRPPTPDDIPEDVGPAVRASFEQYWSLEAANSSSEQTPSPLGGYSGGPVLCLQAGRLHLVGCGFRPS